MAWLKFAAVLLIAAGVLLAPWQDPPFAGSAVDALLAVGCALIATGILGTFGARSET